MTLFLVAYYRVSTPRQGRSGLGLEAQRQIVDGYARQAGVVIIREYTEVESGRRNSRPKLAEALAFALAHGATLVVAKLDRLARDAKFLLTLVDGGAAVHFCDLPGVATGDPIVGRLVLTVLAAIAEFEGRRISQRCKEAMAVRRARGDLLGSRDPRCQHMTDAHRLKGSRIAAPINKRAAAEYHAVVRPVILDLRHQGKRLREIAVELNRRFPTRRGKRWTLANVSRVVCAAHQPKGAS